jgi:predicted kinase
MSYTRLILITGLPGAGKTTLARTVAARYRLPLLAKDLIKEPLLDAFGPADAEQSRRLSTLSFDIQFAIARELYAAHTSMVLEGNFRPGEHEEGLRQACPDADLCQVLCRVAESERLARLLRRQSDPTRHAGHRDNVLATVQPAVRGDTFLNLPGAQLVHDGADDRTVLSALDGWWNSCTL